MRFGKLCANELGNVTLIFALSGLGLVGVMGGTVEVVRIVDVKAKLQGAADAAALASLSGPGQTNNSEKTKIIEASFGANVAQIKGLVPGTSLIMPDYSVSGEVSVTVRAKLNAVFNVGIFNEAHSISVAATALASTPGTSATPICVPPPTPTNVALQAPPPPPPPPPPTGNGCLWAVDGPIGAAVSGSLNAPTCNFHAHTIANLAINTFAINKVFARGAAGGVANGSPGPHAWAVPNAGALVQGDPFPTGLPQPTGACNFNNLMKVGSGTVTLNPGVYCGNTIFTIAGGNIKFNPGLYIFRGGLVMFTNSSIDATKGVTMFFDDATPTFTLSGKFDIEAPTSGPYAGLAMYEKYGSKVSNTGWSLANAGGSTFSGLIYFPSSPISVAAAGTTSTQRFLMVARSLNFAGNNWKIEPSTIFPPGVTPLAAPLPVTLVSAPPASTAPNLLPNGSFELPVIPTGSNLFASALPTIPNWTTTNAFEYWNSSFINNAAGFGTDGVQYAELTGNLTQSVNTLVGQTYEISFDYRYGNDGAVLDNRIEVLWDGKQIGTIDPPTPTATPTEWMRIVYPVVAPGGPAAFTLRQVATANWANGASIDRVRIFQNSALTPPSPGCAGGAPALPPTPATPVRLKA